MTHIALWLDHDEARIFHVDLENVEAIAIHAPHRHLHRHEMRTADRSHPADALHYFQEIARALQGADTILVMGPAGAKNELVRHLHEHVPGIEKKIAGVETVDHPTDRQIVAHAKKYFLRAAGLA